MRICYFLTARPSFCSTRLTALQFRRFDADHGEHALGLPPNRKVTIFCQHNELIPTSFDKSSECRHSVIETRPSIILTISAMSVTDRASSPQRNDCEFHDHDLPMGQLKAGPELHL